MDLVDRINGSLGKELIRSAVQGFDRKYKLKTEYLSPAYTTRWGEVLKIRI
jgi:DNA polymerase V